MKWYIKSPTEGYFIGECLGLGFFENDRGIDTSPAERPIEFESQYEAQVYLNSWVGGCADCFVTNESPSEPEPEGGE
jgi:hypothetical protein